MNRAPAAATAAGESLLAIINDILDFSRIEAGQLVIELTDFDPADVVEEVAALMSDTAHQKGLELVADIDPAIPALVTGDALRFRQVLVNFLSNGLKFTEPVKVAPPAENPAAPRRDKDGLEITREIIADPAISRVRRILLTSGGDVGADAAAAAGINARLTKPTRVAQLHDAIASVTASAAPPASAAAPERLRHTKPVAAQCSSSRTTPPMPPSAGLTPSTRRCPSWP